MKCLSIEQLAAVAAGEGSDAVFGHVATCATCRDAAEGQASVRELVATVPKPKPLAPTRRTELAANVLASAEYAPPVAITPWRIIGTVGVGALAAAATIALMMARDVAPSVAPVVEIATLEVPAPPAPAPVVVYESATIEKSAPALPRLVPVHDGEVALDASDHHPLRIVGTGSEVTTDDAKLRVVGKGGAIVEVAVFAGSAELVVASHHTTIHAGDIWRAPVTSAPELDHGMGAFRIGWTALRDARYAEAIAAFDRATDAVIAEDATYWAAIATERSGDHDGAKRRLEAFVDKFPDSPRASDARDQIDKL